MIEPVTEKNKAYLIGHPQRVARPHAGFISFFISSPHLSPSSTHGRAPEFGRLVQIQDWKIILTVLAKQG
jgi:hypothetical protein